MIPRVEKRGFWDRLMYCGVEAPAVDTFMYSDVHIGVLHGASSTHVAVTAHGTY